MENWMILTVVYALFAACVVFPPTEFVSSGLTTDALLTACGFLSHEDAHFVAYHVRRTAATVVIHAALPLGYFLCIMSQLDHGDGDGDTSFAVMIGLLGGVAATTVACFMALAWRSDNWSGHPLCKTLSLYASASTAAAAAERRTPTWTTVAANVDAEFRRIDKFTSRSGGGGGGGGRVVVTDSWVIGVSTYAVHIVHQADVRLSMTGSREVDVSHLAAGNTGVQFLSIRVESTRRGINPFTIGLSSLEYAEFKDKLRAPIANARRIVIHLTLSDRFVEAFKAQVDQNPRYVDTSDDVAAPAAADNVATDNCIGCMQTPFNVKLQRLCTPSQVIGGDDVHGHGHGQSECRNCYCRPMWCVDCMGKWFASRQDQDRPDTWLAGRSPCPTCRATFCMLDVCLLGRRP